MNTRISEKVYIKNQVQSIVLQQSVSRKDRCKPIYLFHSTIKTCVYGVICFIISGILCIQEVQTEEIEGGLLKDKIVEFLEKFPESADNLYIGPLRIHPSLEISEAYDDNVFDAADPDVVKADFYTTVRPAISLALPIRRHSIAFDYNAEIYEYTARHYTRLEEQFSGRTGGAGNLEQDHVNQSFGGEINLNFYKGFSISLSDRVSFRRIPGAVTRRTNSEVQFLDEEDEDEVEVLEGFVFNTFTRRRDLTNNVASLVINLPDFFNKLDFDIHYSNQDISYKGRIENDSERNTDSFGGTLTIRPLPKIRIWTGFDYGIIRYDSDFERDSILQKIPFNISWQPTVKSNFFLNASFNTRDYGRRSIFENFKGYDATLGYRFNVTERDNLTIKIERSLREQQFQTEPLGSATIGDNNPYFFTQINMDWIHRLPRNFSFRVSPAFQRLRFSERAITTSKSGVSIPIREKINLIRFETSFRYDAPRNWLFGEISYRYQDRDSNLVDGDLIKNEGQISVGISF